VFVLEASYGPESRPGSGPGIGVVVTGKSAADEGSEACNELEIGDIIHALNGITVKTVNDLRVAAGKLKPGDVVVLRVERKRRLLYLAFQN
jgi:S1-C subfamily serine protease